MAMRLGEILVRRGVLTPEQSEAILEEQRRRHRPFGVLAEEMFEVCPRVLQDAWAEQYETMADRVDPARESVEVAATRLVSRRQAWQFRLLPLRFEHGAVVLCTTRQHLPRALAFAYKQIGPECSFVLAEDQALGEALQKHYPWEGPVSPRGTELLAEFKQAG